MHIKKTFRSRKGADPLPALKPFGLQAVTPKEFLKLIGVIK